MDATDWHEMSVRLDILEAKGEKLMKQMPDHDPALFGIAGEHDELPRRGCAEWEAGLAAHNAAAAEIMDAYHRAACEREDRAAGVEVVPNAIDRAWAEGKLKAHFVPPVNYTGAHAEFEAAQTAAREANEAKVREQLRRACAELNAVDPDPDGDRQMYEGHIDGLEERLAEYDADGLTAADRRYLGLGDTKTVSPEELDALEARARRAGFKDCEGESSADREHRMKTVLQYGDRDVLAGDAVNSPAHYKRSEIETIDAIRAALGEEGFLSFCRGNCLKYVWRAPLKGRFAEDMQKAAWYARMAAGDDPRKGNAR